MLCLESNPVPLTLPLDHPCEAVTYLVTQRRVLEGQALDLNGDAARSFLLTLRSGHFLVLISETLKVAIASRLPALPVPPLENVDANFQAMAAATPDFTAVCDGQPAACCANISLYNANSQSFSDVESLPPQGSAYIVLMLMVPKDWKQLKVTYVPTFLEGKSLTFVMNASDVIRS